MLNVELPGRRKRRRPQKRFGMQRVGVTAEDNGHRVRWMETPSGAEEEKKSLFTGEVKEEVLAVHYTALGCSFGLPVVKLFITD